MRPSRQHDAVGVTLCDAAHRPAIDLKMVTEIPTEIGRSLDGEAARREVIGSEISGTSLCKSTNEHCAPED